MIFVTVGTHFLPFDRLLQAMNGLVKEHFIHEKLVVQSGHSKVQVSTALQKPFFTSGQMIHFFESAECVITHAGPATLHQVWKFGKFIPIVVPRLRKYNEHVSDHQLYFAQELKRQHKIRLIHPLKPQKIHDYLYRLPRVNTVFSKKRYSPVIKLLTNYLEKL